MKKKSKRDPRRPSGKLAWNDPGSNFLHSLLLCTTKFVYFYKCWEERLNYCINYKKKMKCVPKRCCITWSVTV